MYASSENDHYMTQKSTWDMISMYLPRDKVLWEAFYGDGQSGNYLRELGFEVIHESVDFYTNNLGEVIVSNPPYSQKREVFQRLKELDKPFCMLVPTACIQTRYFQTLFGESDIQLIVPSGKIQFDRADTAPHPKGCSFYTCFVCYKMNLPRNNIFI